MAIKSWVAAARLRTLPLAFSCILLGNFIAISQGAFTYEILILSLLTTLFYQVLSNYANDYGDGVKGTDADRQGERRAVAAGEITPEQMRNAVVLFAILAWISGALLSYLGTESLPSWIFYAFLILNTGAVISAIRYTVGGTAYGYKGYGDVYVLIFFGWVGVVGSHFLQTQELNLLVFLPATSVGFLAMGVLNLNNMRDLESDVTHGKMTVPVKIGRAKAKTYHSVLLIGAVVSMALYIWLGTQGGWAWLAMATSPIIFIQLRKARKAETPREFDPLLKPLALSTLLFALISGLALNFHLL
ncbi:1,4-dihydroxy-2-naphthoate octaprenyltransferase [Phaeocystidibacter luteus]|uniref:1,4-dihydroxy-2-naphthoate octaprenyltransferase n=1 Tax=Phaeocystidibacter luteus TaxID=911197 RepID=A0A6N6RMD2_9FLAO|nr:1,4-dihydroxy-2-naphthoate octaprenyltransferase [Phaeocystidibacter luteus]KAB2814747.1 1,4-dihydroxy-2-naphthoate octaprenyltransferase [Phaeocystidibacter luteus]